MVMRQPCSSLSWTYPLDPHRISLLAPDTILSPIWALVCLDFDLHPVLGGHCIHLYVA